MVIAGVGDTVGMARGVSRRVSRGVESRDLVSRGLALLVEV